MDSILSVFAVIAVAATVGGLNVYLEHTFLTENERQKRARTTGASDA